MRFVSLLCLFSLASAFGADIPHVHHVLAHLTATDGAATVDLYGIHDYEQGKPSRLPGCFVTTDASDRDLPQLAQAINGSKPFSNYIFASDEQPFQFPHDGYQRARLEGGKLVLTPVREWSPGRVFEKCGPNDLVEQNPNGIALRPYLPGWICFHTVNHRSISVEIMQNGFAKYRAEVYTRNLDVGGQTAKFDSLEVRADQRSQSISSQAALGDLKVNIDLTTEDSEHRNPGEASLTWNGRTLADHEAWSCLRH